MHKKEDFLGTGAIRVFTDQDYLTGNCVNSLLCTERYHDVMFSLLGYSLNVWKSALISETAVDY